MLSSTCDAPGVVHTIGHSTRAADTFLALLATHAIACLVDVRRWPASRRHPHFAREPLAAALAAAGLTYVWRQDLGGFRTPAPASPNTGWRVGAFRAYADFMLTGAFAAAMADLERLAAAQRIALMCAEAVPWRCHRQLLADAFTVRGWPVRHILDEGCSEHRLPPFAEPDGTRIVYPEREPARRRSERASPGVASPSAGGSDWVACLAARKVDHPVHRPGGAAVERAVALPVGSAGGNLGPGEPG